jgi:hypothetical protein
MKILELHLTDMANKLNSKTQSTHPHPKALENISKKQTKQANLNLKEGHYVKYSVNIVARQKVNKLYQLKIIVNYKLCLDYGPVLTDEERHLYFTEEELRNTSFYRKLKKAFGDPIQFPSVNGREFSTQYDRAGQYTMLISCQPMLEPTLVPVDTVRPRLGVCANLDLHSFTPAESFSMFGACLQSAYQVITNYLTN